MTSLNSSPAQAIIRKARRKRILIELPLALRLALKPPERLTVSQWADKNRVLDNISSKPGPWKTSFVPYTKEPMDAFTNKEIEQIILVWGTQSAKTECINNMIGYAVDQDPGPAMVVYPEEKTAEFASNKRIQTMVLSTESIARKFNTRSKVLELDFIDMFIALVSANSPSQLASRPIRYLFRDEIDKYNTWSGDEASPLKLTKERTKAFSYNRKIVDASTPVTKNKNIWPMYLSADARYKYQIPCPHCKTMQPLVFKQIKWPKEINDSSKLVEDAAWYECCHCKEKIHDGHKQAMLRLGEWKVENKTVGRIRSVAYHLNSIYSPFVTFGQVAKEFLESKDEPKDLMNFVNSWLAEPWEAKGKRYKSDTILEHKSSYNRGKVHQSSQILVAGVDVQLDHFWWGVRAWGPDMTSWLVDYGRTETWTDIEKILRQPYPINETGETVFINKACIDSGYNTDEVYKFCAYNQDICVPTKGSSRPLRSRYVQSKIDRDIALGLILYIFDPNQFKDFIAGRLAHEVNAPGAWMLPADIDKLYADQIVAEQKVEGKWEPISSHAQNHMLDVEVNIALAAELCGVRYLLPVPEMVAQKPEVQSEAKPWVGNTNNWMKR
jgi:phage terminase large subunit GpA-like protein